MQRRKDGGGGEEHRAVARQRDVEVDGTGTVTRLLVLDPAARLHQAVVGGPPAGLGMTAVAGDRAVDEARVLGMQTLVINAEPLGCAGCEALDEHVRRLHQVVEGGGVLVLLQVQHDALLAPVPDQIAGVTAERVAAPAAPL